LAVQSGPIFCTKNWKLGDIQNEQAQKLKNYGQ